jgi:hypothetical protein
VAAMRAVCGAQDVIACHLAGGTHHAFRGIILSKRCIYFSLLVNSHHSLHNLDLIMLCIILLTQTDFGEGYCVFSDIAVAANLALLEHPRKCFYCVLHSHYVILNPSVHPYSRYRAEYTPSNSRSDDTYCDVGRFCS